MKILIVEDHNSDYQILNAFLEDKGYETKRAVNVDDAIKLLREYKPDILLLDIQLEIKGSPDLDRRGGIKVLERMQIEGMLGIVHCFITSVFCDEKDIKEYMGFGIKRKRIFKKAFDIEELVDEIKKLDV